MLWPQQEALSWVTAVEEQIKKMLTETVSHKRMVHEGGRIIVVGGTRRKGKYEGGEEEEKGEEGKVEEFLSLICCLVLQNSSTDSEKREIYNLEGNNLCADCNAPSELIYYSIL